VKPPKRLVSSERDGVMRRQKRVNLIRSKYVPKSKALREQEEAA